ncbi:hypothetical protein [Bdellovibrio sp. HCB274]|uniref:hypothetical protein n=1 Tax=Bdellovibrio sp. HCB274 TaxID=3394361 RepID=UPI0039B48F57
MKTLKIISLSLLVVMMLGGYALISASAEYRAQQDSKTITVQVSSSSSPLVSIE